MSFDTKHHVIVFVGFFRRILRLNEGVEASATLIMEVLWLPRRIAKDVGKVASVFRKVPVSTPRKLTTILFGDVNAHFSIKGTLFDAILHMLTPVVTLFGVDKHVLIKQVWVVCICNYPASFLLRLESFVLVEPTCQLFTLSVLANDFVE